MHTDLQDRPVVAPIVLRVGDRPALPTLLTVGETAALLRTSRKAIYAMIERHHLPGIVRIRRRVLVRHDALLDWLGQNTHTIAGKAERR